VIRVRLVKKVPEMLKHFRAMLWIELGYNNLVLLIDDKCRLVVYRKVWLNKPIQ